jgi:SAM-dependent methyltransferase
MSAELRMPSDPSSFPTEPSHCPLCGPNALHRAIATSPDFEYRTSGTAEWVFHQCLVCDTLFLNPRPSRDALSTIYPENYYAFSFEASKSVAYAAKSWLDELAARTYVKLYPGRGLVCDVGAGDGRLLKILGKTRKIPAERIYGIEPALAAVEAARSRKLDVRHASMESFDWKPDTHGLVILQQVIEHVGDPRACLRLVARALTAGGALVIETPNSKGLDARVFGRRHWGGYHTPRHFFLFNPMSLARLAESEGLLLERVVALPSPNFWIQSVHHLASERNGRLSRAITGVFRPHPPGTLPLGFFTAVDLLTMATGSRTSNMRLILRKGAGPC